MNREPTSWARWGPVSRVIARSIKTEQPAVLILSLPRSGSSWVGDMLGGGNDALYLREPLTQSDPAITRTLMFDPYERPDLEPTFRKLADKAFGGLPDFPETIVRTPAQWALRSRRSRRVVIKEVNPLAARWLIERFHPRVVFLLRHPVAVALSSQKQGWLGSTVEDWGTRGRDDALILRKAWSALEHYPARETVLYESLCCEPVGAFRKLFDFAGLRWSDWTESRIREYSADSRDRADAWRREASPEAVAALRRSFNSIDVPWFRGDDQW